MSVRLERLDRLLSRLGYGSRSSVAYWIKQGMIEVDGMPASSPAQKVDVDRVRLEGEELDHPHGLTLIYHKPVGYVCSHKEEGQLIYDQMPEQWLARKPQLVSVGRLDKETSGLLILTDDGQLNHWLASPKHLVPKTYHVGLARPLQGNAAELFASGTLMLEGETDACKPAELQVVDECHALLTLHEGRYHQVRRMFAAVGNHVETLARTRIGALKLADTGLVAGAFLALEPKALVAWIENGKA